MNKPILKPVAQSADDPLVMISEVMKTFDGDWQGADSVTVVRSTTNANVNKRFLMDDNGEIRKEAQGAIKDAIAVVVGVPDVHAMGTLLELVASEGSCCLISGRFLGAPGRPGAASDLFRVLSSSAALSVDLPTEGWGDYKGLKTVTRSLANTAAGTWVLLDCDFVSGMPPELELTDYEAGWWPKMVEAFPALDCVGRVHVPSSTSRLVDDRGDIVYPETPSSHTWVQIVDPDALDGLRPLMLYGAARSGIAFVRRNAAGAGQLWTIFDPSTFSRERLAFEGCPVTNIEDYTIAEPDITVVDGGRFDTGLIPPLTPDDFDAIAKEHDLRFTVGVVGGVRSVRIEEESLTGDAELILRDRRDLTRAGVEGQTATVAAIHISVAGQKNPAIRAQIPYRDSTSFAATMYLGRDRMPFLNDFGTSYTYRISLDEKKNLPEGAYRAALVAALLSGDEEAAKWTAATYGAVLGYKGRSKDVVRELIVAVVAEVIKADPTCFLPDYPTKSRNKVVTEYVKDALSAVDVRLGKDDDGDGVPAPAGGNLASDYEELDAAIGRYNERMIFAEMGKKPIVIEEIDLNQGRDDTPIWEPYSRSAETVQAMLDNERAVDWQIGPSGQMEPEIVVPFRKWRYHEKRNTASGVYFKPECNFHSLPRPMQYGGMYNLWQGYCFEPAESADDTGDDLETCLYHLRAVMAGGDEEKFKYLINWLAALIQHPWMRGMVMLVFKSEPGTGKNTFSELFLRALFGWHSFEINKAEDITGRFNGMFGYCALVVGNEALWGGDKASKGAIKTLIDEMRRVEMKFMEAQMVRNYAKFIFYTNEDWFIPDDFDGRRFAVFDVSSEHKQDPVYFGKLRKALVNGRGALLRYLMDVDVDHDAVRKPPAWASEAGLNNKLKGADGFTNWLYKFARDGEVRVAEKNVPFGKYNLTLGDGTKFLDDEIDGGDAQRRDGNVICQLSVDGETAFTTDLLYQSYLTEVGTMRRQSGEPIDLRLFGKKLSGLKSNDGEKVCTGSRTRKAVFDSYAETIGSSEQIKEEQKRVRGSLTFYRLGSLDRMREAFESFTGAPVDWPDKMLSAEFGDDVKDDGHSGQAEEMWDLEREVCE